MAKLKGKELAEAIDRYGELKSQMDEVNNEVDALAKTLRGSMRPGLEYEGQAFALSVREVSKAVLDVEAVKRKLKTEKDFLSVVSVTMKALKEKLSQEDIDKVTLDYDVTLALSSPKRLA